MYAFLISAVTPRPIALISSRSKVGFMQALAECSLTWPQLSHCTFCLCFSDATGRPRQSSPLLLLQCNGACPPSHLHRHQPQLFKGRGQERLLGKHRVNRVGPQQGCSVQLRQLQAS
jgi:hypothetical protein